MLFWLFRTFLQSLFISNATNPPFTLGLRVKGDKRARLTSFPGVKVLIDFWNRKRAMEDERKNYMLYLSRIAKREVSFSDVGDYLVSQFATTDNYSTDFQIFTLNGLSVGVENDLLSEALRELPDKKREILLLFYFMDMSDSEIADLLKLNRSTVYRHRTSGLALIKKFMEEFEE